MDRVQIPKNCLDVLAQSLVGMSLEHRWKTGDAYRLIRRSYCYHDLKENDFSDTLDYLASREDYEGIYSKIWYDRERREFGIKKGSRMIYFLNVGTIPDEADYHVVTSHGLHLGELSEKFVERLSAGYIFVL